MFRTHADDKNVPLTPYQLLFRDNVPATERMPERMAERLARQRLYLSLADTKVDLSAHLRRQSGDAGLWELDLPAKSTVGLPGLTGERLNPKEIPRALLGKTHLDAFKPAWADHVFHPKLCGRPEAAQNVLRTIEGRRVHPCSEGIFGVESRQIYYPTGYPWSCIGRVIAEDLNQPGVGTFGCGVLVGPRHVLTAGHVAPWGAQRWSIRFIPGCWNGESVLGPGMISYVSDFRSLDSGAHAASAHDISLLRLYEPLGDTLGYFGHKVYNPAWQDVACWWLCGYPDDVSARYPSYENGIAVLHHSVDGDAMELEHQGDTTLGDSGGPFFGIWEDGYPYVIGTVSAHGSGEGNNICAGGPALSSLINYWRENWK